MATTIQINEDMKNRLQMLKIYSRETYNDILERLLEDIQELNEETKKELEEAMKEYKEGKYITHEELVKELGF